MIPLRRGSVTKMRHKGAIAGLTWQVDEFAGDNRGLVIAEVELASSPSRCRPWVGVEVTRQGKCYNGSLAQRAVHDLVHAIGSGCTVSDWRF
jgi:adenylate cyclase